MNRRHVFQESRDLPQRNNWTILFAFFPLALLLYVWNSVQEEQELWDPRDAVLKYPWDIDSSENETISNDDTFESSHFEIPKTGIWIYVESWNPGMTDWRAAFSEVMILAKKLDAVLVEPGIQNGELVACHKGIMALSEVYNRSLFTDFYPKLASCTQFDYAMNQLTVPQSLDVCFHPEDACFTSNGDEVMTDYRERISTVVDDALEQARTHPHNMVVLRLHDAWKSSLDSLTIPAPHDKRTPVMDRDMVKKFQIKRFHFLQSHYQFLHSQLQAAGISTASYAVVHWRPEGIDTDYLDCAQKILQAKKAMNLPPTIPFFLLSSLSTLNPQLIDETKQDKDVTDTVLALLDENGFLQLENLLPPLEDSILYAVMDLILGEQAFSFATCSDRCRKPYAMCNECNTIGSYGSFVMSLRDKDNPNTFPCWPKTPSELQVLHALWNA